MIFLSHSARAVRGRRPAELKRHAAHRGNGRIVLREPICLEPPPSVDLAVCAGRSMALVDTGLSRMFQHRMLAHVWSRPHHPLSGPLAGPPRRSRGCRTGYQWLALAPAVEARRRARRLLVPDGPRPPVPARPAPLRPLEPDHVGGVPRFRRRDAGQGGAVLGSRAHRRDAHRHHACPHRPRAPAQDQQRHAPPQDRRHLLHAGARGRSCRRSHGRTCRRGGLCCAGSRHAPVPHLRDPAVQQRAYDRLPGARHRGARRSTAVTKSSSSTTAAPTRRRSVPRARARGPRARSR